MEVVTPQKELDIDKAWTLAYVLEPDRGEEADRICSTFIIMSACPDLRRELMACHQSLRAINNSRSQEEIELEIEFIKQRLNKIAATFQKRSRTEI